MTKRDPKTGRFVSSSKQAKKPKKKTKPKPQYRIAGKFAKTTDTLNFGNRFRRDLILRERWAPIERLVMDAHDEYGAVSADTVLGVFSDLSDNKGHAVSVTFLHFPKYSKDDDGGPPDLSEAVPFYSVFLGPGLDLIRKISGWFSEGALIANLSSEPLSADQWKPDKVRPIWNGEVVETKFGKIFGAGDRQEGNSGQPRQYKEYKRAPRKPRKRNKEREKERQRLTGKKRNKGNVAEQKRRYRERVKAKKAAEKAARNPDS